MSYYIRRYVVALCLLEFFAFKILDPYYIQFMTTERGLGLTPTQFGLFVSLASAVTSAIDYLSGAFADRLGRRLSWGLAMFSYGLGMLWLSSVSAFGPALVTAVFMGTSYAFASGAREAWLYDNVGQEGTRQAFGKVYLYSVPFTMLGMGAAFGLGGLGSLRLPIALTGLIVLADGLFIMTFPENYGSYRRRGWLEVLKVGFRQFLESRVLWLTAAQSFFFTLPIWITTAWWITYLVQQFGVDLRDTALAFGVTSLAAAMTGFCICKMKATDYRKLILWPTLLSSLAFLLMPLAPTPWAFVALVIAAVASGYFRGSGITLLENEQISEERATALSFLNTLRSAFWAVAPLLWGALISAFGLEVAFFLAGAASLISLLLLILALALRGG
ncbi:MAG: MFS transporter [Firmicutes bacterium]|nr:MFS transporter [Bacillota bacterium]